MSLYDRVVGEAIGAAGSWDQTNPVGVSKQSRKIIGNFPLPLRRKRKEGEQLDPNSFEEQQPAPISGWLTVHYPAGTKHAGKADVVIGKGGDRKRAKKVADALRWIYDKRVKQEEERPPPFKELKKGRKNLHPDERQQCFDVKAVWHNRLKRNEKTGKIDHLPTPAVWKSQLGNKTWYVTNTHRAYNVRPTLKGAIGRFHKFIRSTA